MAVHKRAFGNLGRADNAQEILNSLEPFDHKPNRVILLNEIREGDKGYDEMKLVRQKLDDTHRWYFPRTKEPIGVPDQMVKQVRKSRIVGIFKGVARQSPARMLLEIIFEPDEKGEPETVLLGGHFYAGAKNGQRKWAVKKLLIFLYNRMFNKLKRRAKKHNRKGRHVEYFMDTNWRGFPKVHPDEETLFNDWPDVGRVIPAPGYKVVNKNHRTRNMDVEKHHDAHLTEHEFVKKGKR